MVSPAAFRESSVPSARGAEHSYESRLAALEQLIGETPLVELDCSLPGRHYRVYAKLESYGLTGSIKDRMALHVLKSAWLSGELEPGDTIVEATSGNTGISFAALGSALGHPVRIYMPDWMSRERVQVIESLGARIVPVSHEDGGFLGSIRLADEYAAGHRGAFRPQQFSNPQNVEAHRTRTGPELLAQLAALGLKPTGFVAGVGTGGTVMGVGRCLREALGRVAVHPLEPENSPTLRTGYKVGRHRIQGISDEFIPQIVRLDELDSIISVWDGDAILMSQRLARELGLAVGISSGANLLGALQVAREQGATSVIATVFADCNKKYLSTDLCREEPVQPNYLSPQVELHGFRVMRGR